MTSSINKRSVMTLFSDKNDIYSHQVRIVLAEKGVPYEIENAVLGSISEDLLELNPYGNIPTLVDRELVLFNPRIIMEYLDERFPHPPLMPVYPVFRGQYRLNMYRIEQDWYSQIDLVNKDPESVEGKKALAQLKEDVLALAPVFADKPYFMSEDFSLVDCYIAPLLWRMQVLGVKFSGASAKPINAYMTRVSQRDSFIQSIGGEAPKHLLDDKE
ncbi:glutathione S-transferase N-terminal domain-containing protein [Mannheimia sp. AT1]|uniref:Glutathione S-transferase N-terminal domain-containing protein n=1 Tax=Mannheimia cairinae TaxID=3025936 RepID=A0ABT5MRK6_9PAST|nr:glutathione S-transferase N-terminal domain-containing protein [Mannheimia cairinae]MDD0824821.1 glutathione S-transferase N-terminal domain-containing protein [Mannheimia cairinae]MDD0826249.1 glutathione S-transferase N-terminal domain-containing protein [Mannheimia cairinae]